MIRSRKYETNITVPKYMYHKKKWNLLKSKILKKIIKASHYQWMMLQKKNTGFATQLFCNIITW